MGKGFDFLYQEKGNFYFKYTLEKESVVRASLLNLTKPILDINTPTTLTLVSKVPFLESKEKTIKFKLNCAKEEDEKEYSLKISLGNTNSKSYDVLKKTLISFSWEQKKTIFGNPSKTEYKLTSKRSAVIIYIAFLLSNYKFLNTIDLYDTKGHITRYFSTW